MEIMRRRLTELWTHFRGPSIYMYALSLVDPLHEIVQCCYVPTPEAYFKTRFCICTVGYIQSIPFYVGSKQ